MLEKTEKSRSARFILLAKHYYGKQINKGETGGASSTHGGDEKCKQGSGGET
jgi:hypothetical protein